MPMVRAGDDIEAFRSSVGLPQLGDWAFDELTTLQVLGTPIPQLPGLSYIQSKSFPLESLAELQSS